ncbi:MAG: hypothetical protein J2P57_25570, partial [Acidimicrobiaceae bacterium]|nr:hypothetical protein [Acidimicrobiaceae bacterium]
HTSHRPIAVPPYGSIKDDRQRYWRPSRGRFPSSDGFWFGLGRGFWVWFWGRLGYGRLRREGIGGDGATHVIAVALLISEHAL